MGPDRHPITSQSAGRITPNLIFAGAWSESLYQHEGKQCPSKCRRWCGICLYCHLDI